MISSDNQHESPIEETSIAFNQIRLERTALYAIIAATILGVVVITTAFIPEFFRSAGREEFGAFGDFVGGVLNPLFTFLTFLALIFTIILQQRELLLARTEFHRTANAMERENFEATVFRLSSLIREGVNSIDITFNKKSYIGTDAFQFFYDLLKDEYRGIKVKNEDSHIDAYNTVYEEYGHDFGHYYRLLYNTFRWIKRSKENFESQYGIGKSSIDVDFYAKIIRAQLSDFELAVFYYNYLSGRSDNFSDLLREFNLFDNIDVRKLLSTDHEGLVEKKIGLIV
jgi:hypothetical protein